VQVKPVYVTVNILCTICYHTKLVSILITKFKIQNSFKTVKTGCVYFVECSLYAPC